MALSAVASVLVGLTLVLLIVAVTSQRDSARTAFRSQEALAAGSQLENAVITIENGLRGYVASGEPRLLEPVRDAMRRYRVEQRQLARLVSQEGGQRERVALIGSLIKDYVDLWARSVIDLASEDLPRAQSQMVENDVSTSPGSLRGRLDPIRSQFAQLFERERAVIEDRQQAAEQRSTRAITFGIGGLAFVIAVAVAFTLYLRRSIVRPVLTVADATGRLAAGDLATRVPTERDDELGDLAHGFNTMADSLARGRAELERSNAELTRSNAELEQFASVTSHDLQAPLTTISTYAELLERRRGAAAREGDPDLVDGIRDATQQARALIRDLLEYSRAGRGQLHIEEVPAGLIVDEALERLAGAIEQRHAQVEVGAMPVVLADRGNLCRVFQNLVGNAVKFTREETPRVRIEAERHNGLWRFSVCDNGIGMNPDHIQRIFEPFQRLHGEEEYSGTGIGLAVCERIVDQHGGRIWVSSTPGEGSVFYFTLPGVEQQADPGPAPAAARAGA